MHYRYLLLAIVLAVPAAAATYNMKGSYEPDTTLDANDGYMTTGVDNQPCFADGVVRASGCATNTVYFNHLEDTTDGPSVGNEAPVSPNVAVLQTSFGSPQEEDIAFLGVWKDCNNDGYVGLGENAQWEYRSALLAQEVAAGLVPDICPVQSAPTDQFHGLVHNDGNWVHEFIPIGYDQTIWTHFKNNDPYMIFDPAARVWGDNGLPGANVANICWVTVKPIGTLHTVGSIEDYVDCNDNNAIADNVAPVIVGAGLGAQYATIRATHNPWGEVSDPSAVYVFGNPDSKSCGAAIGPSETVAGDTFQARQPTPQMGSGLSPAGTIRGNAGALDDCDSSNDVTKNQWEYQAANAMYGTVGDETQRVSGQHAGDKVQSDQPMVYAEPSRNLPGESTALGPSTTEDLGVGLVAPPGLWQSQSLDARSPWQFDRACVPPPQQGGGSTCTGGQDTGLDFTTYYAFVTPGTQSIQPYALTFPGGSVGSAKTGTYGAEACGSFTTGIHGIAGSAPGIGWDCDASHWYLNQDGSTSNYFETKLCSNGVNFYGQPCVNDPKRGFGEPMGGYPGWAYDLRDVDCYDASAGALRSAGVSWATVGGGDDSVCINGN